MHHHPARAMYDQFEDILSSITMQLRSAIEADAGIPPPGSGPAMSAGDPLQRSSGWARQVSSEIGSVLLDSLGVAGTIEWHVRQFQKCTGIPCELTVSAMAGVDLPVNCADTIFDIYSEALSNVARHARASRVAIVLNITLREVTLLVRDNGIGLGENASRPGRGGVAGMQARARIHRGFCQLAGTQGGGTTVTVSLPVER
jgi:signal transduction histidine kinase